MAGELGAYPEHSFKRTVPGDVETVRERLCRVLEDFNYLVLNENPIQAKRPRQKNILVAMVLDYDVRLTIAFRSISPASTLVTFDYAIEQLFTKGEMQALEREAEAMLAMAQTASVEAYCPSCGAESASTVRFCRACGKPIARTELPSELEVMRLTASASAAQIEITLGLLLCLAALLIDSPIFLFSNSIKAQVFGWIIFALGEGIGIFYLQLGLRRLHKSLNPAPVAQQESPPDIKRVRRADDRAALAAPPVSITEGTTELINPPSSVPISIKAKDTGSME